MRPRARSTPEPQGCRCRAGLRAVFPACVQKKGTEIIKSTPHKHFTAAPDCRVICSAFRCIGCCSSHPVIRSRIVSATGVELFLHVSPAPNDHVIAGPHCCVTEPGFGRVGRAGGSPIVCAWIVFAAGIEIIAGIPSSPNDHLVAGPDSRDHNERWANWLCW